MDDHAPPLQPDELDELLSAELDGELAAAALDLGLTTDDAAARLRSTPGIAERRAALTAARDLLREPNEIEELLAARLRAKAVRAAEADDAARRGDRRNRRRRLLLTAGGLAAAIAAVVGIAAGLSGSRSGTNSADAKRAASAPQSGTASTAERSTPTPASALGPFSDVHQLALEAVSRAARAGTAFDAPGTSGFDARKSAESSAPAANSASAKAGEHATSAGATGAGAACAAPAQLLLGGDPVLRATATLSAKPVVVLVFAGAREHTVVVEDTNCTLLNVQMLG
jgi:hypothetical protein